MRVLVLCLPLVACSMDGLVRTAAAEPAASSTRPAPTPTTATPTTPAVDADAFPPGLGLVFAREGRAFVAVERWPALPTGAPERVADGLVAAPVLAWPAPLAAWRQVTLRDVHARPVTARARRLVELRWVDDPESPSSAGRLWSLPPRDAVLAVELASPEVSLAPWAHPTSVPPSQVFARASADPADIARARSRFHASEPYRAIAAEYARFRQEEPKGLPRRWVDYEAGVERVTVLRGDRGDTLFLVEAAAGSDCGGFGAALWILYEAAGDALVPRSRGDATPPPLTAVERGGRLLLVGHDWVQVAGEDEPRLDLDTEPFVCGC